MGRTRKLFSFLEQLWGRGKKILLIALGLYAASALALYFVDPFFHAHQHLKWVVAKEPTCISEGIEESQCYCGLISTRPIMCAEHTMGRWFTLENGQRARKCLNCSYSQNVPIQKNTKANHGSAGWIGNTTVIVSVFATDHNTPEAQDYYQNKEAQQWLYQHLAEATQWITRQCENYKAYPYFIYNWFADPDLIYYNHFTGTYGLTEAQRYDMQRQYLLENVPSEEIMTRYGAQNILYIFFNETTPQNALTSYAYCEDSKYDAEIANIHYAPADSISSPSTIAMLILRSFGAPSLRTSSKTIPLRYIEYFKQAAKYDIMQVYALSGSTVITQNFCDLDAYYLGLIDSHSDVEVWGLGESSFSLTDSA